MKLLEGINTGNDPWPGSKFMQLIWTEDGVETRELEHFAWPAEEAAFAEAFRFYEGVLVEHSARPPAWTPGRAYVNGEWVIYPDRVPWWKRVLRWFAMRRMRGRVLAIETFTFRPEDLQRMQGVVTGYEGSTGVIVAHDGEEKP